MIKTKYAIVTLTNSEYLQGSLALYFSLKENEMKNNFIILYDELTTIEIKIINSLGIALKKIEKIENPYKGSVCGIDNQIRNVFSKLYCWSLIEYEKIIFIDSDILNLKNFENLFELNFKTKEIYASKAKTNDDDTEIINSGFILLKPNIDIFNDLILTVNQKIYSYNNSDQGFINTYFKDNIIHLEDEYNLSKRRTNYSLNKIINLHFVGQPKPWHNWGEKGYERYNCLWNEKYNKYMNNIQPLDLLLLKYEN
jgi:lipopolysaccharide biosynthesis glycosyltransferase